MVSDSKHTEEVKFKNFRIDKKLLSKSIAKVPTKNSGFRFDLSLIVLRFLDSLMTVPWRLEPT